MLEEPPELEGLDPGASADADSLALVRDDPERVVVEARLGSPAILVLADAWDLGWGARVDGREQPLMRANALFRAVALEAGEHVVEFRYRTPGLVRGVLLSTAALATLGLVAFWRR